MLIALSMFCALAATYCLIMANSLYMFHFWAAAIYILIIHFIKELY